jgi:hypothetical protein
VFEISRIDPVRVDQTAEQETHRQTNLLLGGNSRTSEFHHSPHQCTEVCSQRWISRKRRTTRQDGGFNQPDNFINMSFFLCLAHSFGKRIFAVGIKTINQPRVM